MRGPLVAREGRSSGHVSKKTQQIKWILVISGVQRVIMSAHQHRNREPRRTREEEEEEEACTYNK